MTNQPPRTVGFCSSCVPGITPVFGIYDIDGAPRLTASVEHYRQYSTIRVEDRIFYHSRVAQFKSENESVNKAKISRQELSFITFPGVYKCITTETASALLFDINDLVDTIDIYTSEGFDRFVAGVSSCIANTFSWIVILMQLEIILYALHKAQSD